MTNEIKAEVEELLRAGDRLKAIEYLEERYNISTHDASILVEALERETAIADEYIRASQTATSTTLDGTLKFEVAELLKTGRKLQAVQHVRARLQLGLREAVIMVEEVAREVTPGYTSFNVSGCLQTVAKGIGYFVMAVAIMFLAAAVIVYFVQERSISTSDRVTGLVNEMHFLDTGESAPIVLFEWHGEKHVYQSTHYSNPPDYVIGQAVPVFVNRDDPEDITLDTFSDRWALIVGFGIIGSGLMLISIVFLYFARRKF